MPFLMSVCTRPRCENNIEWLNIKRSSMKDVLAKTNFLDTTPRGVRGGGRAVDSRPPCPWSSTLVHIHTPPLSTRRLWWMPPIRNIVNVHTGKFDENMNELTFPFAWNEQTFLISLEWTALDSKYVKHVPFSIVQILKPEAVLF